MASREHYTVSGNSIPELQRQINFILARLADRMDKIEGVRGTATIASNLDMSANKVVDVAQGTSGSDALRVDQLYDQGLNTSDGPTFSSLTVLGDLIVGDDMSVGDYVFIRDENGTIIHSFGDDSA